MNSKEIVILVAGFILGTLIYQASPGLGTILFIGGGLIYFLFFHKFKVPGAGK